MKFSSETFKNKTDKILTSIDFTMKNEFFYKNAYTIIKSNHLFNDKNYLDILETINSNIQDKAEKQIKLQLKENIEDKSLKSEEKGENVKISVENSPIKTQSENLKIKINFLKEKFKTEKFSKNFMSSSSVKKFINNPEIREIEKEGAKTLKLKKIKIKSENEQESKNFSEVEKPKSQRIIPNLKKFHIINTFENERNLKTFSNTFENNFSSTTSSPDKGKFNLTNYSTQSPENFSINLSSKNLKSDSCKNYLKKTKKFSLIQSGKNFLDELNQIKEKYICKFEEKYFSNNTSSSLKNRLKDFGEFGENSGNKMEKNFHPNTKTIFKNYISEIMNKYQKEKKLEENTEPDPITIKLRILDNLENSIPEYSKLITKLKRALTNMEKRKVVVNYKNFELGEKLDDLISLNKTKLSWDFYKINKNCLPVEFQRKILKTENILENLRKNYKKSPNYENDLLFPKANSDVIKTKFKSVGKAKILIVPKEIKKGKEIYEDQKIFHLKEIRNEVKEVLSPQTTNLKVKKFFDELAVPKIKTPSENKRNLPRDKILSDCKKFEKTNLSIVNKIKKIKKKFENKSMYLNPKSAFYEVK